MPKMKKCENDENQCPMKKISLKKQLKSKVTPFKFDIKQILKDRKSQDKYWERSAELDEQIKVVDELFEKEVHKIAVDKNNEIPDSPKSGFVIFDSSKYNIIFKNNFDFDVTNSYLQLLYLMSIEENELRANIYFNNLMEANWSPAFDDIQNILINWGTDVDTLVNKLLLKLQINDEGKIKQHNFILVIRFITLCIQESQDKYSVDDLLTLAKFAASISLDYQYGQINFIIKKWFSTCIETAFDNDKDTTILRFSQELYSNFNENLLLKMVIDLFLPLEGQIMKKIYTYLSYKLFKLLLGRTNELNPFPLNINGWFVQDLVDMNYFRQNPKEILSNLIQLLEHVVPTLNLYKNEKKLSTMYDFLHCIAKPAVGLSESSLKLVNILDHWRLHLFRLHVNTCNNRKMFV